MPPDPLATLLVLLRPALCVRRWLLSASLMLALAVLWRLFSP